MQTLLTCFVTRLQTKFLLLIIRASKRIYILVIGQISSFANILPANWFRLAYSPIFYPSNIFPRTVHTYYTHTHIQTYVPDIYQWQNGPLQYQVSVAAEWNSYDRPAPTVQSSAHQLAITVAAVQDASRPNQCLITGRVYSSSWICPITNNY